MPKQTRRKLGIDGLAGQAWADDNHTTHWTEGETINPNDLLEEVVIKSLDQPGATLLDHIALSVLVAKNIRVWNERGGDLFKTKKTGTHKEAGKNQVSRRVERSGAITDPDPGEFKGEYDDLADEYDLGGGD